MLLAAGAVLLLLARPSPNGVFPGLRGPTEPSVVPSRQPTPWRTFHGGAPGRLAVLLTEPKSCWLGLAFGLRSIGIPFTITTNAHEAVRHRVVLVYPALSGAVLDSASLRALAEVPASGGTLVAFQEVGGGLHEVFGFARSDPVASASSLTFSPAAASRWGLTDSAEVQFRLSPPQGASADLGLCAYAEPRSTPAAVFDDGRAAITHQRAGGGHACAFGLDLGRFLFVGYNNRDEGLARSYANGYEPAIDVFLRILLEIYREGEPDAVTLGTVPEGRSLSVLLTHDVDYSGSVEHSLEYARFEAGRGIRATYFVQTKYVTDYNDEAFFNPASVPVFRELAALGMELGSHTVAHSLVFDRFPLGTGSEQYPDYRPFVRSRHIAENGTVLGELRVSKFLLEAAAGLPAVLSFRPGELSNPFTLPQALLAVGYRFSSSATANNALTHLPFQLTCSREFQAQSGIYEFPITIEDELPPALRERLPDALALARRIARYGGLFNVLIHPNVTGDKLAFEQGIVQALQPEAWFDTVSGFGAWWAARDRVETDVESRAATERVVRLRVPIRIRGLALSVPATWSLRQTEPADVTAVTRGRYCVLEDVHGDVALRFELGSPMPP